MRRGRPTGPGAGSGCGHCWRTLQRPRQLCSRTARPPRCDATPLGVITRRNRKTGGPWPRNPQGLVSAQCLLAFLCVETRRALLLIADIGGYTEYMQVHRSILGHAEAATTRLLKKVVSAARDFDLIEIEGDAVFLSRRADALDGGATVAAITDAAVAMHRAFHAERRLVELNVCPCDSCTQTSGRKLKFVAHVGEVATQTIKRRRKLAGIDVIL